MPTWRPTSRKVAEAGDTPNLVQRAATRKGHLNEVVQFLLYMQGDYAGRILIEQGAPGIPTKKTVVQSDAFLGKKPPQHTERVLESFQDMKIYYRLFPKTLQWINAMFAPWSKVVSGRSRCVRRALQTGGAAWAAQDIDTVLHGVLRLPLSYLEELARWCRRKMPAVQLPSRCARWASPIPMLWGARARMSAS